jgi:(E)-4-hydroxy-3-methylbut-2-enyl-diphosphate synthase
VSLTVPAVRKHEEIEAGRQILADIAAGRLLATADGSHRNLNIISCPGCSRVENEAFIDLAEQVRTATDYAAAQHLTIAIMGCRVNGPGETDSADLGLWCGPSFVNLNRGGTPLGAYPYTEIVPRLLEQLDLLIAGGLRHGPRRRAGLDQSGG